MRSAALSVLIVLAGCRERAPAPAIKAEPPAAPSAAAHAVVDAAPEESVPLVEFPLRVLAATPFTSPSPIAKPAPLAWNEKTGGVVTIKNHTGPVGVSKQSSPLPGGAGELIEYTLNTGFPGEAIVEHKRGGVRVGFWPNIQSMTRDGLRLLLAQATASGSRQILLVDLATSKTTRLPDDLCTRGGAQFDHGGRIVAYGEEQAETSFCVIDASLNVVARLVGHLRWDPHGYGLWGRIGTLPKMPEVFYAADPTASTVDVIELKGTRRAMFEFDFGGTTDLDLKDFTLDAPILYVFRDSPDRWEKFVGKPRRFAP